jgi:hypothetical protein
MLPSPEPPSRCDHREQSADNVTPAIPHSAISSRDGIRAHQGVYLMGDIYLPHPVMVRGEMPGALIYNLESPLTHASRGWPGTVNLRCEEDHSLATFGKRPVAVCLANNHIMDFGVAGLTETVQRLSEAGVAFFGAGEEADNCRNPLLLTLGDRRLGLVGYVCPSAHPIFAIGGQQPGVAPIDLDRIQRDVHAARASGATRVVVCLHWGIEEVELPRPEDVRLARAVAEMDVDLVIGHHAHCIQPFEIHAGVPIFYGLGNAIFPDIDAWANYDSEGEPGEPYRKKQNYWNRASLAVAFDLDSGAVRVDRWTCDGNTLRLMRRGVDSPRLTIHEALEYEGRFRKHHFFAVWRKKLVNFARSPRMPRIRHLRSLLGILREARGAT